jgi:hypothetical protein
MAPTPSEAPACATKGQARYTNHEVVEIWVVCRFKLGSRFEDSEGAWRQIATRMHAQGAERVDCRIEAGKVNGAAGNERVVKNQVG